MEFLFDKNLLTGTAHGLRYERQDPSENYVCVPPALLVTDYDGGMFTLGNEYVINNGLMEFNVLRNDVDTGEIAHKIEYSARVVTIYGYGYGKKRWSGKSFI
jgi:hypothetical protein